MFLGFGGDIFLFFLSYCKFLIILLVWSKDDFLSIFFVSGFINGLVREEVGSNRMI